MLRSALPGLWNAACEYCDRSLRTITDEIRSGFGLGLGLGLVQCGRCPMVLLGGRGEANLVYPSRDDGVERRRQPRPCLGEFWCQVGEPKERSPGRESPLWRNSVGAFLG